jgi:hypothetical protein
MTAAMLISVTPATIIAQDANGVPRPYMRSSRQRSMIKAIPRMHKNSVNQTAATIILGSFMTA